MKQYKNTDEYIDSYPKEIKEKIIEIRSIIKEVLPSGAKEKIAYGIPTFTYHGNLVHFGAAKDHIGFYPAASGVANFKDLLKDYKTSKGTIQFPLDQELPKDLIQKIVKFRVSENLPKTGK